MGNEKALEELSEKINAYLDEKFRNGEIREELYNDAKKNVMRNIEKWLNDEHIIKNSPGLIKGLFEAAKQKRWEDIIYAFVDDISFGTGGIRGLAAFNEEEVKKLSDIGIDAPILRGPNTINDIVLLLKSAGLANYASDNNLKSIAIGYDSRIRGKDFAELIAKLFLSFGIKVYLFDEACPYPELTYAVPFIGADLGVLVSASHNDKRYNGYKISSKTGAQIDILERNRIYNNYIKKMETSDIRLMDFESSGDNVIFLGGSEELQGRDYLGKKLIDVHTNHINHIKKFILDAKLLSGWASKIKIGYCAFYGAGYKAVPRILGELGFTDIKTVHELNKLDGTFPCFHLYQQPDPGDEIAEETAVRLFKKEYSEKAFEELDIMISTDPDADRVGFVVRVPENQREIYKTISKHPKNLEDNLMKMMPNYEGRNDHGWHLLTADEAFTILLWYRLHKMVELNNGVLPNAENGFVVMNHVTTDAIARLAQKYGLGVVKAWVGFTFISRCVEKVWAGKQLDPMNDHDNLFSALGMDKNRNINFGAFEQSNGFSILGGKPPLGSNLGENGHTRDKDGILAAALFSELVAYAKSQNKSIIELLDEKVYLDPDIGFFANYAEACPYWGQFEGPTGLSKKINILKNVEKLVEEFNSGEELEIAGKKVIAIEKYATGKYDELHRWKGFPDEGMRFFFNKEKSSYLTIRPSGTSPCIRFHIQLKEQVSESDLASKKAETYSKAKEIVSEIRKVCRAN